MPPYFRDAFRGFLTAQNQDDWYARPAHWGLVDEVRALGPGLLLGIYSTDTPAEGFTPVLDSATGRTRHEIFGLQGPSGPWVGVDEPTAEAR